MAERTIVTELANWQESAEIDHPLVVCVSSTKPLAKDLVEWCGAFSDLAVAHCDSDSVFEGVKNVGAISAVVVDLTHLSIGQEKEVREQLIKYLSKFTGAQIISLIQKRLLDSARDGLVRKSDEKVSFISYPVSPTAFQVALSRAITQYDFAARASSAASVVTQLLSQVEMEVTRMLGLLHDLSSNQPFRSLAKAQSAQQRLSIQRLASLNRAKRVVLEEFANDPYWSIIVELYLTELMNKLSDFKGVALRLGIPLATFTRRIEHMKNNGVVESEIDSVDKRRHRLRLTESTRRQVELLLNS